MGRFRNLRKCAVALLFFLLFIKTRPLKADIFEDTDKIIVGTILICADIIAIPFGLAYILNNLVSDPSGEPSSVGSQIVGYTAGAMNLGIGIGFLCVFGADDETAIWLGIADLTIGAMDVGFTIWAASQPKRKDRRMSLGPMIVPDVSGNAAFGVGLRLVDW